MVFNSVNSLKNISDFYVVGINYRNTDAATRGDFAINNGQYESLLQKASTFQIDEFFVLSTCNRTEIFAVAPSAIALAHFICSETKGNLEVFNQHSYCKNGEAAINHLLEVAAGIDSQILGDYEIISQIKKAAGVSKEHNCMGLFLEKIVNITLQSSRAIRSNTQLSSGSVSVSFAAVQYIQEQFAETKDKKILLIGTGKIGRNTCKNIVRVLGTKNINLINRTAEKAEELANELGLTHNKDKTFEQQAQEADIILVATNANAPTLHKHHIEGSGAKLIIDLSIPYNVSADVIPLPGVRLVNVDELSKVTDNTLQMRKGEVPKAEKIISNHIADFIKWYKMRQHVPVIKAAKCTLESMQLKHQDILVSECVQGDDKIQKVLNNMAVQMQQKNERGCTYIQALNDFMTRS
ncbi:MAG: glutamyl-tRNA reductase [Chitinophagaceae bacterium]|nr:glutamyl-tRNA reductase [Chitinophagaceae bacterium]